MEGSNRIVVKTEELEMASDVVLKVLGRTMHLFESLEEKVLEAREYWEGSGVEAHISSYQQKQDYIDEISKRLTEHVNELRTMAGIYSSAEEINISEADSLPSDAII